MRAMSLADRLRKARAAAGLSQRAAAKHLGIAAASLAQWEIGRTRPDIDRFPAIAALYQLPLAELMADAMPVESEADVVRLYRRLSPTERKALIAFLASLAA